MRVSPSFRVALLALLALAGCDDKDDTAAKAPQAAPVAETPAAAPAAPAAPPPAAPAEAPATPPRDPVFSAEQLDQMLAPLALYPDSLLAQVLMATTYPGNVADAVAWSKAHPDAKGDDAVRQVANQPWDPSVQSLVAFPDVLVTLGQDPAWVQRVGDAFLAQPDAVMDSVQRLRRQARAAGNLESNDKQTVTVQEAPPAAPPPAASSDSTVVVQQPAPAQTIVIQPADPQVVYVPSYNPNTAYGSWPYPSSPPVYYPPPPSALEQVGTALATGLAFGAGVAIVNSLWGDCDWGRGDVDIDVNRYNNINVNRRIDNNVWRHDPLYRNGVPYRDRVSQQQFDRRLGDSAQRDAYRGFDQQRSAERARARESLQQRGIAAPATSNREAIQRAQTAGRDLRNDPQARQRAQATLRERQHADAGQQWRQRQQASGQNRPLARDGSHQRQTSQRNLQARQQVRQQHAAAVQGPRNNAFAGSRNPSQARANIDRGRASQLAASRPHASGGGRQVHRPARGGGGGFHRR
ncbi:hypothetical protein D9M68_388660 [compost metagenome]